MELAPRLFSFVVALHHLETLCAVIFIRGQIRAWESNTDYYVSVFCWFLLCFWLLFTKFGGLCVTNTPLLFIFLTKQGNGLRARHLVLPTMSVELEWMTKHWCLQIHCECLCAAGEREGHSFQFSFVMLTILVLVRHLIPTCGSPVVATLHCKARGHEIISRPRRLHFDGDEVQKRPSAMHWVHAKGPEVVRYNRIPHYGMPHI